MRRGIGAIFCWFLGHWLVQWGDKHLACLRCDGIFDHQGRPQGRVQSWHQYGMWGHKED